MVAHTVAPIACLSSGCEAGTSGACWQLIGASAANASTAAPFPIDCVARGVECAQCTRYNAARSLLPPKLGQVCDAEAGWRQCQWLHGDSQPPPALDVSFLFVATILFAVGDGVWTGQLPGVLQTYFNAASGQQPSAMANLKLWQSLGIAAVFGIAQLNDVKLTALICAGALALSSVGLLYAHKRVASLDSGRRRVASSRHDALLESAVSTPATH